MEDQVNVAANTEVVATPQMEVDTTQQANVDTTTQTTQQDTTTQDVTQTQAFAHRLKDETTKAEQKARDAVIAEMYGESHGIRTYADYQTAIQREREEAERQRIIDAGYDPDIINQAIEKHPDVQFAREFKSKQEEQQQFNAEVQELFTEIPGIKPEQVQPEVWQLRQDRKISLLDAYMRVNFKTIAQQKEQEAIQKLTNNAQASTGSLGGGSADHNTSISHMPKADFEKLLRQVKNGEVKNL